MNDEWVDDPVDAVGSDTDWIDDGPGDQDISKLESFGRGAGQGATFGFQDEASAGLEKAMIWLHNKLSKNQIDPVTYDKLRDELRELNQKAQEANPGSYTAGEVTGAAASTILPGAGVLNVGKGAKIGTVLAKSAAAGGLGGAGYSNADNVGDLAVDTATGAGMGTVFGMGGKALEKGIEYAPTLFKKIARNRAGKALGAGKRDFQQGIDEIADVALDEGVISPFASTEEMLDRAKTLKTTAGKAQGQVYKTIDDKGMSNFNPLDVAVEAEEKLNPVYRTPINKGEWSQLDNTMESILARGADDIPLKEAQLLKEEIGAVAYPKGKKPLDPTPKQLMAQDVYRVVRNRIDAAAENAADQIGLDAGLVDLPTELRTANKNYGAGSKMYSMLDSKLAADEAKKGFGLTDYATAGLGFATLGPKGLALLALKKGADKYGNQVTATGANKLSKYSSSPMFQKLGSMFGKSGRVIDATDMILPNSMEYRQASEELSQTEDPAASHYLLMQRDPTYRMEVKGQ